VICAKPEFIAGLRAQFGEELTDILLNPLRSERDGTATIQRPGHRHSKAIAALLHLLMPGHQEQLLVGRPCDLATSIAVVTTYRSKVALGRKVEVFYRGRYCLAPAGWFDDTKDKTLFDTIIREGLEELDIMFDLGRMHDLGRFITVNQNDTREDDYPSHKTGYLYELTDEEWTAFSSIEPAATETEVAHFELFDEDGVERLVSDGTFMFVDQIEFVRRYFRLLRANQVGGLPPIAQSSTFPNGTISVQKQT
jgi:hypothetical protein